MKTCHIACENMPVSIWIEDYYWLCSPSDFLMLCVCWPWFQIILLNSLLISLSYPLSKYFSNPKRGLCLLLKPETTCVTSSLPPTRLTFSPPIHTLLSHRCRVQLFYFQAKLNWQRFAGLKGIKNTWLTDRQRNRAKLRAEKRGVRGIDKADRGGVQYSLVKYK